MEFLNRTPFTAALYRTQIVRDDHGELRDWKYGEPLPLGPLGSKIGQDIMHHALVVCCRYPLDRGGRVGDPGDILQRPTPEPDGPADPAYGVLLEPGTFPRAGTDVIVLGDAISRGAASRTWVRVQVGPYDESLAVIGDRVWVRHMGSLVPSKPASFERMPVTWARAYGGVAQGEYGPVPFGANPDGRGYYLSKEQAEGRPLPNIEDPENLVTRWSDQPEPVGYGPYPPNWSLRVAQVLEADDASQSVTLRPERGMFDCGHPRLSGRPVQGGTMVIEGMHPFGTLALDLPACPVVADITIGAKGGVRDLTLVEILVDLLRSHVDLTWRKGFQYTFERFLPRRTIVRMRA